MKNWWYSCWLNHPGGKGDGERSRSFGGCIWFVIKYLANDRPNHREKVREMGIWELPGFKSYLMLIISAKELRASPFSPHWQPQLWECGKDLDRPGSAAGSWERAVRWKAFCLGSVANKGFLWGGILTLSTACLFFPGTPPPPPKIPQVINSPHGTAVNPLVSHVDISKYPDVWHQGRKEKNSHMRISICHISS